MTSRGIGDDQTDLYFDLKASCVIHCGKWHIVGPGNAEWLGAYAEDVAAVERRADDLRRYADNR